MIRSFFGPSAKFARGVGVVAFGLTHAAAEEVAPYRFFVGVDVLIPHADDFAEVTSYRNRQALIKAASPQQVPLKEMTTFRWHRHPKVSHALVTVDGLVADRTYSLNSDAKMGWMVTQNHMTIYAQERADMQTANRNQEEGRSSYAQGGALAGPYGARGAGFASDIYGTALNAMNDVVLSMQTMTDPGTWGELSDDANAENPPDTLQITFSVASAEPVARAYAVILADIASEHQTGTVTLFEELGELSTQPRKVMIRRPNLSPGFTVENVRIHVYSHGVELGSNVSERRSSFTRQQAKDYLMLVHLTDHKEGTVLPVPVWELAPPTLYAAKDRRKFDYPVAVSVGPDGEVLAVHRSVGEAYRELRVYDAAALNTKSTPALADAETAIAAPPADARTQTADTDLPPHIVALVRELIFLPALKDGQPVKGIVSLNLADFFPDSQS